MNVSERIAIVLKQNGVATRKRNRTLANLCDVTPQAVAQWFNGSTKKVSPEHLAKIARAYKVDLDWLITGRNTPQAMSVNETPESYDADEFFPEIKAGYRRLNRAGRIAMLLTLQRELDKQDQELKQKEGGGEKRGNIHTHKTL